MISSKPQLTWRRSSGCVGGDCVEVAELPDGAMAVRNSHDPDGPALRFTRTEWDEFMVGAHKGEFDLPATPEPQRV